ncbi:HAD family acid phosphatase [Actinacidiphila glaucinigra]|uniref:HAD family acid phosphatase n=1 Tax=Actinacidiphila glaucinigra TaxID=235986 RepID=UPI002DD9FC75|nr:HAD family acid phosphatase [Actinacidiphila glaucinigra]WSD61674.1 hydrolase [Actinacidiphila glaucinigra]
MTTLKTLTWRRGAVVAAIIAAGVSGLALPADAHAAGRTGGTVAAATTASATASTAASVDHETWLRDVRPVIDQARAYVQDRTSAARPGEKLAIVLDIDNTSLETYFDWWFPPAVAPTRDLARYADSRGVDVFFVTARPDFIHPATLYNLDRAGYPVAGLYGRSIPDLFDEVSAYKTAQRAAIEKRGYAIVANIGNNTTDLVGGHAERTFKLPDYDGLLD